MGLCSPEKKGGHYYKGGGGGYKTTYSAIGDDESDSLFLSLMTQRRKFLLSIYCFDATEGRINSTQLLSLLFFHFNQVKAYLPIPTYFDPLMMMVVQCRSSIYFLIVMCLFTNYGLRSSKPVF